MHARGGNVSYVRHKVGKPRSADAPAGVRENHAAPPHRPPRGRHDLSALPGTAAPVTVGTGPVSVADVVNVARYDAPVFIGAADRALSPEIESVAAGAQSGAVLAAAQSITGVLL